MDWFLYDRDLPHQKANESRNHLTVFKGRKLGANSELRRQFT